MGDGPVAEKTASRRIVGFIEAVNEAGIHGWAYDDGNIAEPLVLLLHIDGEPVREAICDLSRNDVAQLGHPRAKVGFHIPIPFTYFDDAPHDYHLTTADRHPVALRGLDDAPELRACFKFSETFDARFYGCFHADVRAGFRESGSVAAFRHWAEIGRRENRHATPDGLFRYLAENPGWMADDLSVTLYRVLREKSPDALPIDWEAAGDYLTPGGAGRPWLLAETGFVIDLYFEGRPPSPEALAARLAADERVYLSVRDLLNRNGIAADQLLELLNVADYVAQNPGVVLPSWVACVRHFVEHGIAAGHALSFEQRFDHEFAGELDPAYAGLAGPEAYLLWLDDGLAKGMAPNPSVFLDKLGLADIGQFPPGFDAAIYLARNPDLVPSCRSRWEALRHFVTEGLAEDRKGCPIGPGSCDIYRVVADRLSTTDHAQAGRRLYETLLAEDPHNVLGLRHYGDCLLRLNEPFAAARVYEQTITDGHDSVWTHLNLATCYLSLQRWADACRVIRQLAQARPGDQQVEQRHQDILRQAHGALAAEATWLATNGFLDAARAAIALACELISAPLARAGSPARAAAPIRAVAIIADLGLPQCKFYRVDQKTEQLDAVGIGWQVFNCNTGLGAFLAALPDFDAVILYRAPASPALMQAIRSIRSAGLPVFFEIDDLMFDPVHFPDSFDSYGGQIDRALYASLVLGTAGFAATLATADYAIASTPPLAEVMAPRVIGLTAFVHRNGLGQAHADAHQMPARGRARDRVRIFYGSGTKAHNADFEAHLAPALARLLRKWGDRVELFIMGYLTLPRLLLGFQSRIQQQGPVWDLKTYWNILREMDINLAVLKPGLLSDCKSEIKWLEAAMLGVPSVVSATRTYEDVIIDGETGHLVRRDEDWFTCLDGMVGDAAERRAIGAAAREAALDLYSPRAMGANLLDIFARVTDPPAVARIRVLVVNVFFYPQAIGGATRVVMDNVRDIAAAHGDAVEQQVFATTEGGALPYVVSIHHWEGVKVTSVTTPTDEDIDRRISDPKMATIFAQAVDRFRPDLIHFHCIQRLTASLCEIARMRRIPYVVTVHDGWWISDYQFLVDEFGTRHIYDYGDALSEFGRGDGQRLERVKVKQEHLAAAERVIAVSEPFAAIYRSCGFERTVAIPNGVSPLAIPPRRPSRDGRVRLAHIGGASGHKGFNVVRDALFKGRFRNLALLVVDHAMEPGTVRHAMWGTTPVRLQGKVPQAEIGALYSEVDVLLAPSLWPESYGLVTREAALAGCWVVASDRGAIGQDVSAENGFVIDVGSSDALIGVLALIDAAPARFLQSPPLGKPLRTARDQADDLVALYRSLAAGGTQPVAVPDQAMPDRVVPTARPRGKSGPAKRARNS